MISKILIITGEILLLIALIFTICYRKPKEKEIIQTGKEERKNYYLKLQNMTTQEILLFKNKEQFIKDVGCYDVLRNFYTDNEIINKCYPNYKRLE